MAEPIVRTFVIDTTKAEQNLQSLDAATTATTVALDALYNQLFQLDELLGKLSPNSQAFNEVNTQIQALESTITQLETGKIEDIGTAIGNISVGNAVSEIESVGAALDTISPDAAVTAINEVEQAINSIDTSDATGKIAEIDAAINDINPDAAVNAISEIDAILSTINPDETISGINAVNTAINEVDASGITGEIASIETSLESIDTTQVVTNIESINDAASSIDISNVATDIDSINTALGSIDTTQAVTSISEIETSLNAIDATNAVGNIESIDTALSGIDTANVVTDIDNINSALSSIDASAAVAQVESVNSALDAVDTSNVTGQIENINSELASVDVSTAINEIAAINEEFSKIDTTNVISEILGIGDSVNQIDTSGVVDQIAAINTELNSIDATNVTADVSEISTAIEGIDASNAVTEISSIDSALSGIDTGQIVGEINNIGEAVADINTDNINSVNESFNNTKTALEDISPAGASAAEAIENIDVKSDKIDENLDEAANSAKKLGNNAKGAESGFKKVGSAISDLAKGTGIVALLTAAFNTIKSVISSTQPIADAFSAAMGTFTDIIRDAFTFITDNAGAVVDYFKDIFENPIESLKAFGDAIVDNLIERFNSFLDTLGFIAEGVKNLFTGEFDAALESFKNAGKESIDVLTGVNNTVDRVSEAVVEGATAFGKYVTETYKANAALVALQNNAKLAAAQQARLAEQFDREAELLRQTRDDESKSIQDRIDANTKLGEVLAKQEQAELAAAQAQVAAAQATFNHNKTIDNQVALTQALAGVDGVRAKIAGLKSEQLVNEIALNKELNALYTAQQQSATELAINEKKFVADSIKNDLDRLNAQRAILEEEKKIQLERLQSEVDKYAEGTQARLDAEIAFNETKQQLDQNIASNAIAIKEAENARLLELNKFAYENQISSTENRIAALNAEYAEKAKLYANDAQTLEAIEKEKQRKILAIEQETQDAKLSLASESLGAIANFAASFAKGDEKRAKAAFKIQKAVSIAQATVDTYKGANAIFANAAANPATILFPAQPFIAAGVAIATGLANVATIAQQQFQGGAPAGGGNENPPNLPGDTGGGAQPAQFNPLAAQFLQERPEQLTPRAYVLSGDVASQQEVRQKVEDLSRIG